MTRVSFKFNVFKSQGYKNAERNCSAPIRFLEYPDGTPVQKTFEAYMDEVELDPSRFNFPPLVFEVFGLNGCANFTCDNYGKLLKRLATRKCVGLDDFLDGKPTLMKKNIFAIQSYASIFPDKASAQRCFTRMIHDSSPYIYFNRYFDGWGSYKTHIVENSVKILEFTKEPRKDDDLVRFQVRFDMEVCLKEKVVPLDPSLLKTPYSLMDADIYGLARTVNAHLDQFYFIDFLHCIMFKNENEEESDRTFCLEFEHHVAKLPIGQFVRLLYSMIPSREWKDKLAFWKRPESFDFKNMNSAFQPHGYLCYQYVVPNRTCQNELFLRAGFPVDQLLMEHLKEAYEAIEKKTMEMIYTRMPYTVDLDYFSFVARIRDVRTIQSMEEHCLHVYNALKNLYDYLQAEAIDKGESFTAHVARLVLEQVKSDPIEFMEHEDELVKRMATARINGSYYGE